MKIQNITTAYNFTLSQGYTEIIVINITEGTPENFVPYQTEDIYLISNNCSEFDNVPIYFEIAFANYTGGYIFNIKNAITGEYENKFALLDCGAEFLNGVELIPFTGLPENENDNNMAELDEPSFMSADDPDIRPPVLDSSDDPDIRPPDGNVNISLDTGGIRPPTGSDNVTDYGDASAVIAALAATDTEYASLIQNTIRLIQELQEQVEQGAGEDAEAQQAIAELEAQLEELIGTQGAVNLLLGAIDSAAAGTFGDGSAVTFCSYQAPPPPNPDSDPNTGTQSGLRNIQNRGTDVPAGDELQNPFTSAVVADLCEKLATLSDAVNFQTQFENAGYDSLSDVTNAISNSYQNGLSAGYDNGYAAAEADIISEGFNYPTTQAAYEAGVQAMQEQLITEGFDYESTQDAFQGGVDYVINELNSTTYQGDADVVIQALYDTIYTLGIQAGQQNIFWTNPDTGQTYYGDDVITAVGNYYQGVGYAFGLEQGEANLANAVAAAQEAAEEAGYNEGFDAAVTYANATAVNVGAASVIVGGTNAQLSSQLDAVMINIYNQGVTQGVSQGQESVIFTNPDTGEEFNGEAAVTAAQAYGYSSGFATAQSQIITEGYNYPTTQAAYEAGAASVTPEDGVSQADVDAAVAEAQAAAQAVVDDLIAQINTANASNVAYGEFIESLTSELDILEEFLTSYYGYDPADSDNMFTIPENVSGNAGYQSYFSGGQEYKVFDPRRIVNMNEYINFSGKMQSRTAAPVERDNDLELELTPTAKTGLYILGGGALAFLAFKLFKKK